MSKLLLLFKLLGFEKDFDAGAEVTWNEARAARVFHGLPFGFSMKTFGNRKLRDLGSAEVEIRARFVVVLEGSLSGKIKER